MKRNSIYVIAVIIAIVVGFWLYQNNHIIGDVAQNSRTTNDTHQVTIGYSRLRISLPVFVAKEHGFFEANGLDATLVMYDTAQPLAQALMQGRVELAGYTALPITYNGMIRSKTELKFLTTMIEDQKHRISYLLRPVSQTGQKPTINSIADLKGMSIGILPTIAYKAWIEEILRKNGLDPETDVQIRPIAPGNQALSLKSGVVQALFTNDPAATSAIQAGIAELISPNIVEVPKYVKSPFPFGSFNVRSKWAESNPQVYQKLVRSLNEAVKYINQNPDSAKKLMATYLDEAFQKDVDQYPAAKYLSTGESSQAQFQEIADLYFDIGIIPSQLDVTGMIETEEF